MHPQEHLYPSLIWPIAGSMKKGREGKGVRGFYGF